MNVNQRMVENLNDNFEQMIRAIIRFRWFNPFQINFKFFLVEMNQKLPIDESHDLPIQIQSPNEVICIVPRTFSIINGLRLSAHIYVGW
jgi:hypothetical protein